MAGPGISPPPALAAAVHPLYGGTLPTRLQLAAAAAPVVLVAAARPVLRALLVLLPKLEPQLVVLVGMEVMEARAVRAEQEARWVAVA
jgi:hypothetical protein